MLKRLLFSLLLFCTVSGVFASHFRYGLVTATRISETSTQVTYRLNVSLAWRLAAAPASVPFAISGGNSGSVTVNLTNVTDPSGGWTNSSGTANVTLNKSATPTRIEFNSSAKISTIINNHDKAWDVYTILNTNAPGSTPVTTLPAIINMPVNAIAATFTIPASDPDPGSTMTFGLPNLLSGPLAGQTEPTGFSVNATTGQITLNTTDKTVGQQYNALVTVTDNNGNQIMLDFIINMVGFSNPPAFDYSVTPANGFVYNVIAGQNISFPISATDPDAGSTVSLSVSGLPAYISTSNFSPAFPATGNPSQTTFSWTPAAAQIGTTNIINIIATDNVGVQTTTSVTMKVVAEPAPAFISPTPGESTLRQIIPGVLQQDTIVAQSSLGSNVTIAFATVPTGTVLSPAVPTSGANPGQTIMSWTPTPADFGQHSFSYQAVISSLPTIFVTRNYFMVVNTPPAFSSTPTGLNVNVGQPFSYNVTVADQDIPYGDVIDIVGTTIPSWLTLTSTGNGTAVLSGTPTTADGGINHVDLEAEDTYHHGNPSAVEQAFDINVIACTTPAFANTNGYLQQSTNAGSCDATVTYPLSVSGTPAPSITYVFTGATTGTGSGTGSGQVFNTGITHVVVTASNACTTITNNFDVTVVDNVKPIPVTKNITVYLDATGHATITPADIDNGSHDNCGAVSLSLQNTGTICATAAENSNLTLTAPAGTLITNINFASYGTPTGSCGAFVLGGCNSSVSLSKVQAAALNKNSATISATNTVFGDPCGGTVKRLYVQATYSGGTTPTNSFDCSKLGDNTVTLIVTDANGNTSSTTAIVTVKDNIAPTPTVANLPTITAQCAVTVTRPTATDICAGTITATTSDPLTYNTQGTYTINWSYNDGHGNVSTQTQTVIVKDVTAPVLNGVPANVTVECNAVPARANVTASDNCSTSVPTFTETRTDGACANNYTLTRTWTTTDAGNNTTTATQVITVRDTKAPVLNAAPANTTVSCDAIPAAAILTAADNCDASPVVSFAEVSTQDADVNSVSHYNYTITRSWTATDACGNAAVKTQVITVRDVTAPVITIPANTVLNCQDDNSTAATGVATGTDVCSPVNIVYTDANTQSSDVLNAAHYNYTITRTWTATDVTGNASTGIQVITVHDISAPVITVPANTVLNCQDDNSTVANGVATGSDNCGPVTITYSDVNTQVASITDPAHYNYTITRTWTATDVTGNASTGVQVITVHDVTAPVITVPANTVLNCQDDNGTVANGVATGSDNCGPVTITYSDVSTQDTNSNAAAHYNYTISRTWTATDATGNHISAVQTIKVQDITAPVIVTCPASVTQCNDQLGNTRSFTFVASDNCSPLAITYSINGPGGIVTGSGNSITRSFAIGTTTITWTVKDVSGNTSTCTTIVVINPLPVVAYVSTDADAFCNKTTLTASSSITPASYSWTSAASPAGFNSSPLYSLGLANSDGAYNVWSKVDATGCISPVKATYNFQKQNLAGSYTILAYKEVELGKYNKVVSGSVGVMTSKGDAEFNSYSSVNGVGSFVKAPKIDVDKSGVVITSQVIGLAAVTLPTMQYNTASTKSLPNYTVPQNGTVILTANYSSLKVKKGASVTVTGSTFGSIDLEAGASIKFTNPVLNIDKLSVDDGAKDNYYSYVSFAPNTSVRISSSVSIGSQVRLNQEAYKVTFYMNDLKPDEEKFTVKGGDTKIIANIYMPNGKLRVTATDSDNDAHDTCDHKAHNPANCKHKGHGHKDCDHRGHDGSSCNDDVYMTGLFIAEEVESKGNTVIWNSYDCSAPPVTTVTSTNTAITTAVTAESKTVVTSEEELKITVMPNPSATFFTLKLESKYATPVTMRVMDANGRVIDAKSGIGSNSSIQIGQSYLNGTYYAEMTQGTRRKVVQLIKIK